MKQDGTAMAVFTDTIEQIARAVALHWGESYDHLPADTQDGTPGKRGARAMARTVIRALHEPTAEMLANVPKNVTERDARACWKMMIEGALGERR